MKTIDRIALIAGSGQFPLALLKAAQSNSVEVITISILSSAEKEIERISKKNYWIQLGQAKELIGILQKEGLKYAVMAGKVNKAAVIKQSLMLDEEAKNVLRRIRDKKDDTILSAIANRLNDFGIELIDSTMFMGNFMAKKGVLTKKKPDMKQRQDIEFGFKIAKQMGSLDIGQSVIVKDKAVIAVEAIEGTDAAIIRAGLLAGKGAVIVKTAKPNQDLRFDVPVVGYETLQSAQRARAGVLAVEAGKVLMLQKEDMIEYANRAGICITGV
jgi:UDP-2,3-diacylglucosamine hydrolase